ncbi:MAG: hypothetical protein WA949_19570 [Phormidesmis sp.]
MESLLAAALLTAMPANLAQATPQQTPPPVQVPVQIPVEAQLEADTDQPSLTCAPGQFPSAFSDVLPTDWAYQAVIRLSSQPIECFNFPAENSTSR